MGEQGAFADVFSKALLLAGTARIGSAVGGNERYNIVGQQAGVGIKACKGGGLYKYGHHAGKMPVGGADAPRNALDAYRQIL